jgi:RimJ/RimL family protein N-acetyltransferase
MISTEDFLAKKVRLTERLTVPAPLSVDTFQHFHFRWILSCAPEDVLPIRNLSYVVDMSAGNAQISLENHPRFIDGYPSIPRIDFMIVSSDTGQCIGGVNLVLEKRGLEIGKYIGDQRFLDRGVAKAAMLSFLEFLRSESAGEDFLAKTKSSNSRNIALNLMLGFVLEEDLGDDFVLMRMRQS